VTEQERPLAISTTTRPRPSHARVANLPFLKPDFEIPAFFNVTDFFGIKKSQTKYGLF